MSVETYIVAVYWGPREESPSDCALRACRFFEGIRHVDPVFTKWYELRSSIQESARHEIGISLPALRDLFSKGVYRSEADKSVMFELGYRLSFWNLGNGGAWTRGNFHCGGFSPWNTNVCIVNLPNDGEGAERLVQYGILYDLLRAAVDCWDPDHGVVTSHEFRDAVGAGSNKQFAGWLTYLSGRLGDIPALPVPAVVEEIGGSGNLIRLSREPWSSLDRDSILLARNVTDLIGFERRGIK